MNPFQNNYIARVQSWRELREYAATLSTEQACVEIDRWWQQAPWVTHHLHWQDKNNWPDPWTMLSENIYCRLTKSLGMCYTLFLCDILNVELNYQNKKAIGPHFGCMEALQTKKLICLREKPKERIKFILTRIVQTVAIWLNYFYRKRAMEVG